MRTKLAQVDCLIFWCPWLIAFARDKSSAFQSGLRLPGFCVLQTATALLPERSDPGADERVEQLAQEPAANSPLRAPIHPAGEPGRAAASESPYQAEMDMIGGIAMTSPGADAKPTSPGEMTQVVESPPQSMHHLATFCASFRVRRRHTYSGTVPAVPLKIQSARPLSWNSYSF